MYACTKSIPIANKLVSFAIGYKQMLTVLNELAVQYLIILIGQNKYTCQNFDQATALPESGQNWSQRPNFDHFVWSKWSLLNRRRTTAK